MLFGHLLKFHLIKVAFDQFNDFFRLTFVEAVDSSCFSGRFVLRLPLDDLLPLLLNVFLLLCRPVCYPFEWIIYDHTYSSSISSYVLSIIWSKHGHFRGLLLARVRWLHLGICVLLDGLASTVLEADLAHSVLRFLLAGPRRHDYIPALGSLRVMLGRVVTVARAGIQATLMVA